MACVNMHHIEKLNLKCLFIANKKESFFCGAQILPNHLEKHSRGCCQKMMGKFECSIIYFNRKRIELSFIKQRCRELIVNSKGENLESSFPESD